MNVTNVPNVEDIVESISTQDPKLFLSSLNYDYGYQFVKDVLIHCLNHNVDAISSLRPRFEHGNTVQYKIIDQAYTLTKKDNVFQ